MLTGRVVISASVSRFSAGVLHVRLEDVSYADERATVIAETAIAGIAHDPSVAGRSEPETIVPFSLTLSSGIDPDRDYSVRAWLDRDGDGRPGSSDLWSDQSYRVLTRGSGSDVTMALGK